MPVSPTRRDTVEPEGAPDARQVGLATIIDEIVQAGFGITKQTKKVVEFETSSREALYLIKTTSHLNKINLIVDPKHDASALEDWPGVVSVGTKHGFHSHMSRFPKRLNKGVRETPYGWPVMVNSLGGLQRLLTRLR